MKALISTLLVFSIGNIYSQLVDDFSDYEFLFHPIWCGDVANFRVNENAELQSNAIDASSSVLYTASESLVNAYWELKVKINYPSSSTNYATVFLSVDSLDLKNGFNGYFVQLGGVEDEVSLYLSKGMEKVKLIDGIDKSLDGKTSETIIRVLTDSLMNFSMWRKTLNDTDFVYEGSVQNQDFSNGKYFGLGYTNTKTTGKNYFFDEIVVTGDKYDRSIFDGMIQNKEWYSLSSEIIYPDSNSELQNLRIYFLLDDENYAAQIRVFNTSGDIVKTICLNEQVNSSSRLMWRGENEEDNLLNSGIYILHSKLFNLKTGNIKVFKEAIVLVRF